MIRGEGMNCWAVLGIDATQDQALIKKAYAAKLKITRPDEDPFAYQELREAFEQAKHWHPHEQHDQSPISAQKMTASLLNEVFQQDTFSAQATAFKARMLQEQDIFIRLEIEDAMRYIGMAWPAETPFPALVFMAAAQEFDWYNHDPEKSRDQLFEDLLERIWIEYELKMAQSDSIHFRFYHLFSKSKRTAALMHRRIPNWVLRTAGFFDLARGVKATLTHFDTVYAGQACAATETRNCHWWRAYFNETWHLHIWHHLGALVVSLIVAFFSMAFIARGLDAGVGFGYGGSFYCLYLISAVVIQILHRQFNKNKSC
tara:strand:+ start:1129 stop:2073 length:945 start_codon:yes stop_codon:yes gene_type:complete